MQIKRKIDYKNPIAFTKKYNYLKKKYPKYVFDEYLINPINGRKGKILEKIIFTEFDLEILLKEMPDFPIICLREYKNRRNNALRIKDAIKQAKNLDFYLLQLFTWRQILIILFS